MASGSPQQAAVVRRAIVDGGRAEFPRVLEAVIATGALDYARAVAQREAEAARHALDALPASGYKDSLLELASFSVVRQS
jgi:octaprenyl-diphosphate synthase